jgi:hypothetical protein
MGLVTEIVGGCERRGEGHHFIYAEELGDDRRPDSMKNEKSGSM